MNKKIKENIKQIRRIYGDEAEIKKAMEEFGELIQAVAKGNREKIVEEISDCLIMIRHLRDIYEIGKIEIKEIQIKKIERALNPIKSKE